MTAIQSATVVVPARNECGNIEAAVQRIPRLTPGSRPKKARAIGEGSVFRTTAQRAPMERGIGVIGHKARL